LRYVNIVSYACFIVSKEYETIGAYNVKKTKPVG
jgi:hypothetical protein